MAILNQHTVEVFHYIVAGIARPTKKRQKHGDRPHSFSFPQKLQKLEETFRNTALAFIDRYLSEVPLVSQTRSDITDSHTSTARLTQRSKICRVAVFVFMSNTSPRVFGSLNAALQKTYIYTVVSYLNSVPILALCLL